MAKMAEFDIIIAMSVHILALNATWGTGLAALLDAFGMQNALPRMLSIPSLHCQVKVMGVGKSMRESRPPASTP
jgi:hypothetical protein